MPSGARRSRRWVLAGASAVCLLAILVAAGLRAPAARADGDPASDYLIANQVFLTSQMGPPTAAQRRLRATVAAANRAGLRIRVATVGDPYDLGSVTALWGRPQSYARFLSLELGSAYRGRLLVVMPAGLGVAWAGHGVAALRRAVASVPAGADVAARATTAVAALARAAGVRLPPVPAGTEAPGGTPPAAAVPGPTAASSGSAAAGGSVASGGAGPLPWIAAILALAAIVALAVQLAWRRPRWSIPGFGVLGLAAGVVPVLLVLSIHRSDTEPSPPVAEGAIPPPLQWPAGARRAPDFALRDQAGTPVSLRRFRGHPVLLTFTDPLCRNLCPVEAHALNTTVAALAAARRPAIVAVSTDPYANRRRYLLQDLRRWSLVPQWHWAVGAPAALRAVWHDYRIAVKVVAHRVGATTIHEVSHSEVAYLIDAGGHERALFLWPFTARDVVSELARIS